MPKRPRGPRMVQRAQAGPVAKGALKLPRGPTIAQRAQNVPEGTKWLKRGPWDLTWPRGPKIVEMAQK